MSTKKFVFYFNDSEFKSAAAAWESVKNVPGIISLSTFLRKKPSTLTDALNNKNKIYKFNGIDFPSITDAWKSIKDNPFRISFSNFYTNKPTTTQEATFDVYPVKSKKRPSFENFRAAQYVLENIHLINNNPGNPKLVSAAAKLRDAAEQEIENYIFCSSR